jgi:putative SOS response-associated peptidase YedK
MRRPRPSRQHQRSERQSNIAAALCLQMLFYEWQKLDAKTKQPFATALKSKEPNAFAGLWEKWKDRRAGTELLTFTIITTDPNKVVSHCMTECR